MKNATLKVDLADNKMDDVNELIKRLKILTKSNYGVLSGSMIWLEVLQHLGVNAEKEILETFNISDLKTKIYGIKTLKLIAVNTATHSVFLLFKIDENAQKKCDTSSAAEALANAYEELNSLQENIGVEMQISIGFTGVKVKSLKDNSVLSTFISKSELDKVADPIAPIRNAIDSSIRQITK